MNIQEAKEIIKSKEKKGNEGIDNISLNSSQNYIIQVTTDGINWSNALSTPNKQKAEAYFDRVEKSIKDGKSIYIEVSFVEPGDPIYEANEDLSDLENLAKKYNLHVESEYNQMKPELGSWITCSYPYKYADDEIKIFLSDKGKYSVNQRKALSDSFIVKYSGEDSAKALSIAENLIKNYDNVFDILEENFDNKEKVKKLLIESGHDAKIVEENIDSLYSAKKEKVDAAIELIKKSRSVEANEDFSISEYQDSIKEVYEKFKLLAEELNKLNLGKYEIKDGHGIIASEYPKFEVYNSFDGKGNFVKYKEFSVRIYRGAHHGDDPSPELKFLPLLGKFEFKIYGKDYKKIEYKDAETGIKAFKIFVENFYQNKDFTLPSSNFNPETDSPEIKDINTFTGKKKQLFEDLIKKNIIQFENHIIDKKYDQEYDHYKILIPELDKQINQYSGSGIDFFGDELTNADGISIEIEEIYKKLDLINKYNEMMKKLKSEFEVNINKNKGTDLGIQIQVSKKDSTKNPVIIVPFKQGSDILTDYWSMFSADFDKKDKNSISETNILTDSKWFEKIENYFNSEANESIDINNSYGKPDLQKVIKEIKKNK